MRVGILSLGSRGDASTFQAGAVALGFTATAPIKKSAPTLAELKDFFAHDHEWLYLGGHFGGRELSNDAGDVTLTFHADRIELASGKESATLRRGSADLGVVPRLVLWGGCSTLGNNQLVADLGVLFGAHAMLGFRDVTGWKMVDAALGKGFLAGKKHFFTRVAADSTPAVLTDAWMQTAKLGWGGGTEEHRFAAVDDTGQRWVLRDGRVVKDKKLF
ncbi:hypothetical protein ATJ88_3243 [Isoptericola jiangsuensis]|uniref:CHAT domain-containing protein n=1 Tax=Isoptericola jiangsuensis TaxID=548579 RepID=A0A2A9F053_9MICO|nr:hypothetical protein [Isoptericola jiangsuensis]PFG44518.1 hypothetical protein ATJ88_3243 [Isoptericola jiangsuensis]